MVSPADRDVLRFLWWNNGDPSQKPKTYRMAVHLFGGVWSPSCASYALRRTAEDNRDLYPPDVIAAVSNEFYVDDCLMSVPDEESAVRIQAQLCDLLSKGGFRLVKWVSNRCSVITGVPPDDRAKDLKNLELNIGESLPIERALGIYWDTEEDLLGIRIKPVRDPLGTRRSLLSVFSSVYDPLGLVGPFVLLAKSIFQAECRKTEKGWDDPLDDYHMQIWTKWLDDLPKLKDLHLQRCLIPNGFGDVVQAELHHFSDASQKAYGAVSYLRIANQSGVVHCCFMLGKSKLAPMKQLTIPRLELVALYRLVCGSCCVSKALP